MAGFRQTEIPRKQPVSWKHHRDDPIPAEQPVRHLDYLLRSEAFAETSDTWEPQYVPADGKPP